LLLLTIRYEYTVIIISEVETITTADKGYAWLQDKVRGRELEIWLYGGSVCKDSAA